jgi:hypothetical protein
MSIVMAMDECSNRSRTTLGWILDASRWLARPYFSGQRRAVKARGFSTRIRSSVFDEDRPARSRRDRHGCLAGQAETTFDNLRLVKSLRQAAHTLRNSNLDGNVWKKGNPYEIIVGNHCIDRCIVVGP